MFIFLEISTPFVCMRWLLFHHDFKGSHFQDVNSALLFFSFIFGRVFMQMYLVVGFAASWLWMMFTSSDVDFLYKAFLFEMMSAVLINVVLNFYWSWLIIKSVWRMLTRPEDQQNFTGEVDTKNDLE